ncbi:hypothetical protein PVAND_000306 [Polypedilum vanderplanki]|uniref:Peptidase S1 domain-containing protein n=1 Tax=Polypedilum vanderplanki TaxID=319348 RepID=A0A9J6BKJ4_POLVA|nr:hypothetical protein PVAND_000306 [Polypedilum vanderplanki]
MAIKLLIIFFLFPNVIYSAINGDQCVTNKGVRGICMGFYECQSAVNDYRLGIFPQLCQNSNKYTVCCPGNNKVPSNNINRINSQTRPSKQKCDEYSKIATNVSLFGGLSLGTFHTEKVETYTCELSISLIVGGEPAKANEFPHMAALGWRGLDRYEFNCGASLISDRYVLTAAHCEKWNGKLPDIVRLGDLDLRSNSDGVQEQDFPVEAFIRHENYDSRQKKNDIAVVRMRYNVRAWQKNIRPACLWSQQNINQNQVIATGYGSTGYAEGNSDKLLKVNLFVSNTYRCGEINIDNTQICAGDERNNRDTCQGDSGGPLQITLPNNKCTFYIVGITSFGENVCGYSNAVYTRVSAYIDWIERIVWG